MGSWKGRAVPKKKEWSKEGAMPAEHGTKGSLEIKPGWKVSWLARCYLRYSSSQSHADTQTGQLF